MKHLKTLSLILVVLSLLTFGTLALAEGFSAGGSQLFFDDIEVVCYGADFKDGFVPTCDLAFRLYGCSVEPVVESVSWTNKAEFWTMNQYYNNDPLYEATIGNTIVVPGGYLYEGEKLTTNYMMEVFLPDDPSIAGVQTVTVTAGGQRVALEVQLMYLGSYRNSAGWMVDYRGANVLEASAAQTALPSFEAQDAYVTTMTDDDYPTLGRNDSNKKVKYCLDLYLLETTLDVVGCQTSWAGTPEPSAFKSNEVFYWYESWIPTWEAVKQRRTLCEDVISDEMTGMTIYLPNDASIKGWQTVTLDLSNGQRVTYHIDLVWKGDYDFGTGWAIDDQRIEIN